MVYSVAKSCNLQIAQTSRACRYLCQLSRKCFGLLTKGTSGTVFLENKFWISWYAFRKSAWGRSFIGSLWTYGHVVGVPLLTAVVSYPLHDMAGSTPDICVSEITKTRSSTQIRFSNIQPINRDFDFCFAVTNFENLFSKYSPNRNWLEKPFKLSDRSFNISLSFDFGYINV